MQRLARLGLWPTCQQSSQGGRRCLHSSLKVFSSHPSASPLEVDQAEKPASTSSPQSSNTPVSKPKEVMAKPAKFKENLRNDSNQPRFRLSQSDGQGLKDSTPTGRLNKSRLYSESVSAKDLIDMMQSYVVARQFHSIPHIVTVMEARGIPHTQRSLKCLVQMHCMKGDIEAAEHVLTVLCPKYGVKPTKPMYEKMIVWYMTHQRPRRPVGRIWSAADKGVADEELIFTDELKMFTNELEAMTEENAESSSNSPDTVGPESEPPIPTPPAQTLEAQELITEEMELKSIKRSHELFRLMIESGYKPEVTLFDVFMRSYYHRGEFDRVFELYETMKRENVSPDHCIYTILVETAAIGLNNLPKAFDLIREMTNRGPGFEVNLHILTILMNAHLQQNDLDSAKRIFQQILDTPTMKPSLHTYGTFVHTLCRAGETEEAHQLVTHEIPKLLKHPANVVLYNTLLHGYGCLAGNLTAATKVFQELVDTDQEPVVTTYNILISAHARHGEYKGAMKWYQALLEAKHRPTLVTYNIMIHMHLKQDDPLAAQEMYQKMVDSGIVPDMATTAPIVGYFSQRGDWKNVVKVIESSRQVSESSEVAHYFGKERGRVRYSEIVPHNVVLEQMRRNGNLAGVLRRFLEITGRDKELQDIGTSYHNKEGPVEKHNIEPDFRTYDILVRALANMNDLDSARYWFDDAIQRNIVDTRLVNTLMAFYLKAGQCQKAKEVYGLIDECGLVPDPVSVTLLFKANSNEKEDDENDESSVNSLGGGA